MDIPDYKERYGEPETLEEILNYCAFIMGQCGLEHRTLHHFNWFVSSIIFGRSEYEQIMKKVKESEDEQTNDPVLKLCVRDIALFAAEDALEVYNKYNAIYSNDVSSDTFLKYGKAFKEYCEEEYLKDGVI